MPAAPTRRAPFRRASSYVALSASGLVTLLALAQGPSAPRRVVLVSFDGAGGQELARRKADGTLGPDGFLKAEREGFSADRLAVVTPSLTAVSHASIITGAPPALTGVVGNWFHPARGPLGERVSGFDVEPQVETVWEAASRQGRRVASITWPGVNQSSPRTTTPVGVRYDERKPRSVLWRGPDGPLADAAIALPLGVVSYSPPKVFKVRAPSMQEPAKRADMTFVVLDTTDDGRRNYDELLAISARGEALGHARAGEWFPLTERAEESEGDRDVLWGRWNKLVALSPDLSSIVLYIGDPGRTHARPDDFRRTLDRRAGFWPGAPDSVFLEGASPDVASFVEQTARFADYFVSAFEVADRRGDWDLLLAYEPVIDEAAHALTITDPRQPLYTKERAERALGAIREVWRIADSAAARYLRFEERGDVFFVSDHGMRAIHHSIHLHEMLREHGWLKLEKGKRGGLAVAPDSPVDAVGGGGFASVFVNRAGVLPGGVVPPAEADRLVAEMLAVFRAAKDENGEPLFAVVATQAEAATLGLNHPNVGDIVLIAAGGRAFRGGFRVKGDEILGPADLPGQHGFDPDPALDGIFIHVGAGVSPARVPVFRALDVAARVADRLGIAPPRGSRRD